MTSQTAAEVQRTIAQLGTIPDWGLDEYATPAKARRRTLGGGLGDWGHDGEAPREELRKQDIPEITVLPSQWNGQRHLEPGQRLSAAVMDDAIHALKRWPIETEEFKEAWLWFQPGYTAGMSLETACMALHLSLDAVRAVMATPESAKAAVCRRKSPPAPRKRFRDKRSRCPRCQLRFQMSPDEMVQHIAKCVTRDTPSRPGTRFSSSSPLAPSYPAPTSAGDCGPSIRNLSASPPNQTTARNTSSAAA